MVVLAARPVPGCARVCGWVASGGRDEDGLVIFLVCRGATDQARGLVEARLGDAVQHLLGGAVLAVERDVMTPKAVALRDVVDALATLERQQRYAAGAQTPPTERSCWTACGYEAAPR